MQWTLLTLSSLADAQTFTSHKHGSSSIDKAITRIAIPSTPPCPTSAAPTTMPQTQPHPQPQPIHALRSHARPDQPSLMLDAPAVLIHSVCHYLCLRDRLLLIRSCSVLHRVCNAAFAFKHVPPVLLPSSVLLSGCPPMSSFRRFLSVCVEWPPMETRDGVLDSDVELLVQLSEQVAVTAIHLINGRSLKYGQLRRIFSAQSLQNLTSVRLDYGDETTMQFVCKLPSLSHLDCTLASFRSHDLEACALFQQAPALTSLAVSEKRGYELDAKRLMEIAQCSKLRRLSLSHVAPFSPATLLVFCASPTSLHLVELSLEHWSPCFNGRHAPRREVQALNWATALGGLVALERLNLRAVTHCEYLLNLLHHAPSLRHLSIELSFLPTRCAPSADCLTLLLHEAPQLCVQLHFLPLPLEARSADDPVYRQAIQCLVSKQPRVALLPLRVSECVLSSILCR